jgi:hypothetical protein
MTLAENDVRPTNSVSPCQESKGWGDLEMQTGNVEISVKGKPVKVKAIPVNDKLIIITGKLLRVASIKGDGWIGRDEMGDPTLLIPKLKEVKVKADIFTFGQMVPDSIPKYNYYMEWVNFAALPITTFDYWWTSQINDKTRNMVRRAEKKGVSVRVAEFDETLIKGISSIYNETPVRQGRRFWHYGKEIDDVRSENSSYLERSCFIGAYCENELIGFIKLVYMDEVAGMMQILSKIKDREKAPNNALLAKAVEICAKRGIRYLVYSKFTYGKKGIDPLADFKRHNAFQKIDIPRYYVPLTIRGKIGLNLGLHHDFNELLPKDLISYLRRIRGEWYDKKIKKSS